MSQKIISENDCYEILTKYYNNGTKAFKLLDYYTEPVSQDIIGLLGEHLFLKIIVEEETVVKLSFFLKRVPKGNSTIDHFVSVCNMCDREISCYTFLERIQKDYYTIDTSFAPKYYHGKQNELMILEDLSDAGYAMYGIYNNLGLNHIKIVLSAAAKFHAGSLIFEEFRSQELGRRYTIPEEYGEWLHEIVYVNEKEHPSYKFLKSGIDVLLNLSVLVPSDKSGLAPLEFRTKLNNLTKKAFDIVKPSVRFRNVWCHGDFSTKNIMFKYLNDSLDSCKFFDFQLQRYRPPAEDVLILIYQTADRLTRQKYLEDFLDHYYKSLEQELKRSGFDIKNILDRDEFDCSVAEIFPIAKLTKAIFRSRSMVTTIDSYKKVLTNSDDFLKLFFEDSSEIAVGLFQNNESYRKLLTILLEDLRDTVKYESISPEDCHKVLKAKLGTTDYNLINYEVLSVEKLGLLSNFSKLKVTFTHESGQKQEIVFFVKQKLTDGEHREFVSECNLFNKELKFYSEIVPAMVNNDISCIRSCIPNCYLTRVNEVIVLDDYSTLGYSTLSLRDEFDFEMITIVLQKLAVLHASGFLLETKLKTHGLHSLEEIYKQQLQEAHYSKNKHNMSFKNGLVDGILKLVETYHSLSLQNLFQEMYNEIKPSTKYRNTICHGDLWCHNILIKFAKGKPVNCVFVDFQFYRYSPPAQDVISFIYLTTSRKFRSECMSQILKIYYNALSRTLANHGTDINSLLTYEEFLQSCQNVKRFAIAQSALYFQLILNNQSLSKECFNKYPNVDQDEVYKEKLLDCLENLKGVCECSD